VTIGDILNLLAKNVIARQTNFVQDNISKSKKGTVRGLHYQVGDMAQGKLYLVIVGKVLDVAVDIGLIPAFENTFHVLSSSRYRYG
jgi:dTDP-4-dehydrorhamnose 3,5-epimerase